MRWAAVQADLILQGARPDILTQQWDTACWWEDGTHAATD